MFLKKYRAIALAVSFASLTLFTTTIQGQECDPCTAHENKNVGVAREKLTEAFKLSLEVPDCSGAIGRTTCLEIDRLLEDVLSEVDGIFQGSVEPTEVECLSCDPTPHLWPVVDGARALMALLEDKGVEGFTDSRKSLVEKFDVWKNYRCPCSDAPVAAKRPKINREAEALKEITRKCGGIFAHNKRGLLQVFRVPDEHKGCYQSRACREATVHKGFETKPGFWIYDGEFWYIFEERRGNSGRWVSCER
jgi:hypothetical protein